jgi:hypothetical protein
LRTSSRSAVSIASSGAARATRPPLPEQKSNSRAGSGRSPPPHARPEAGAGRPRRQPRAMPPRASGAAPASRSPNANFGFGSRRMRVPSKVRPGDGRRRPERGPAGGARRPRRRATQHPVASPRHAYRSGGS